MSRQTENKSRLITNKEYINQLANTEIAKNAREFILPFIENYTGFEHYENQLKEKYDICQQKISRIILAAILENTNKNPDEKHKTFGLLTQELNDFDNWLAITSLDQSDRESLQNIVTQLTRLTNIFVQKQIAGSKDLPTLSEETFANLLDSLENPKYNFNLSKERIILAKQIVVETFDNEITIEEIVNLYNETMGKNLSFEQMLIEMLEILEFDETLDFEDSTGMQTYEYFAVVL